MSYFRIFRFAGVLALVLNFWTVACHADDGHGLRYRYVALDQIALPTGFTSFFPSAIRDNGWVYGSICDSTCSITQLAYVKDGRLTALGAIPPDMSLLAKARGFERGLPLFIVDAFTQYQEQGVDWLAFLRDAEQRDTWDPPSLFKDVRAAVMDLAAEHMRRFGSVGQAG